MSDTNDKHEQCLDCGIHFLIKNVKKCDTLRLETLQTITYMNYIWGTIHLNAAVDAETTAAHR